MLEVDFVVAQKGLRRVLACVTLQLNARGELTFARRIRLIWWVNCFWVVKGLKANIILVLHRMRNRCTIYNIFCVDYLYSQCCTAVLAV